MTIPSARFYILHSSDRREMRELPADPDAPTRCKTRSAGTSSTPPLPGTAL
ncbi:hypothetical protein [Deinococcus yavapaiensis]|uniref:hypothetical protein n=1 Tax=Deinococcus yavapaiensis TaxID=309889 RepID=UPI00147511EC|nr:hypothetical protein [Deinococcus yavapaiensis]